MNQPSFRSINRCSSSLNPIFFWSAQWQKCNISFTIIMIMTNFVALAEIVSADDEADVRLEKHETTRLLSNCTSLFSFICSPDWSSVRSCDSSCNDDRDSKSSQRQLVSKNKMLTTQGLFLLLQCGVSEDNILQTNCWHDLWSLPIIQSMTFVLLGGGFRLILHLLSRLFRKTGPHLKVLVSNCLYLNTY